MKYVEHLKVLRGLWWRLERIEDGDEKESWNRGELEGIWLWRGCWAVLGFGKWIGEIGLGLNVVVFVSFRGFKLILYFIEFIIHTL